jgi:hypothetical protein
MATFATIYESDLAYRFCFAKRILLEILIGAAITPWMTGMTGMPPDAKRSKAHLISLR